MTCPLRASGQWSTASLERQPPHSCAAKSEKKNPPYIRAYTVTLCSIDVYLWYQFNASKRYIRLICCCCCCCCCCGPMQRSRRKNSVLNCSRLSAFVDRQHIRRSSGLRFLRYDAAAYKSSASPLRETRDLCRRVLQVRV